jgi:hypothetical protein
MAGGETSIATGHSKRLMMYRRVSDRIASQGGKAEVPPSTLRVARCCESSEGTAGRRRPQAESQGLVDLPFSSCAVICANCVSSAALRSEMAQ